ncbi:MAG: hypothetical protein BRD55_07475 [Bacteroidetes bacterium SW_9_63_38]|nr:MAG: hypothetical protein BRD55_07475 [Bacteroidetes bacterium SW_9_63_38]
MSEQTARLVARLRTRLQDTTRRMTWAELAFGAAVAVGTVAAVWFAAALLEASLWLGTTARTALAAAIGTVGIGVAGAMLAHPLGRLLSLLPGPSDETVARKVGEHHPQVADRLVNLLQLAEGQRSYAPTPFIDQAVQQLAADLDDISFDDVEDFGRARRAARLASLPLAAVLAFLLLAPSTFLGASERLLAPSTPFNRPAPFQLAVQPGATDLVRGDSLRIAVRATGAAPSALTLFRREAPDTPPERITLRADSGQIFHHTLASVRESFQYRVGTNSVQTSWYDVEVRRRPLVRELQLTVTPPDYTGRPSRTLDANVGDVSALPGTTVDVTATLGGPPVDAAQLMFSDSTTRPLTVEQGTARGAFVLRRAGTYTLRLESKGGILNRDPIRYQLALQSDARPSVRFLQPTGSTELSEDLTQRLRVQLSDDFGFTRAALYYRVAENRLGDEQADFSSVRLPLSTPNQTDQELTHRWLLAQDTGLDPEPGDVIAYYVKAWDNDTVSGPKSGRTATQRLRMPSLTEQYEELDETQSQAREQLTQLRQQADSVQQQSQQLRRELRRTREADWQDRRQLQRIREKQRSLDEGTQKLSKQMREMNRKMQRNNLTGSDLAKKFKELQKVIDDIDSQKLQKSLDELQEAMKNNNLRRMQQAMEKVQKKESDHKKQLDRTLSLFKQLKAQQKLAEMSRRAGELSELQKALSEKTKKRLNNAAQDSTGTHPPERTSEDATPGKDASSPNETSSSNKKNASDTKKNASDRKSSQPQTDSKSSTPPSPDSTEARPSSSPSADSTGQRRSDQQPKAGQRKNPGSNKDLASEQKRAAKKMQKLQKALQKARKEMKDVQSAPRKQLDSLTRQLQQKNLPRKMKQNSRQLRQNQLQDAQQGQQQMQKTLQQMQKQLSQMKGQMQSQQRQINVAGLRSALENTLYLSTEQEALRTTVEEHDDSGSAIRSFAQEQNQLSTGLKRVADSLNTIAENIPQMSQKIQTVTGDALRAMETATTALDERKSGKATGHQKTSMTHLNELALLLSNLLEQMQNQQGGGSGSSMQKMMQKLKQMSGQQQKLNSKIQKHLSQTQGQRLSPDQEQRRQELAQQQRRLKQQIRNMDVGSEARQKLLGNLQKIAEQMEKSAQELEKSGRRPSRDLLDRQQQILTRLLNAQSSLRTQGRKNEREGQSTDAPQTQPPGALPSADDPDRLRRDLIRALEMGYSSDYEALIKRYFELLRTNESAPSSAP